MEFTDSVHGTPLEAACAVFAAVQHTGDIGRNSVVVVEYRMFQRHFVHLVLHIDHFVCPLIVIPELLIADLLCAFADLAEPEAVHKFAYAFRIVAALDEAVRVDVGGDVAGIGLVILRHRNEEDIFAECLGPLGFLRAERPQTAGRREACLRRYNSLWKSAVITRPAQCNRTATDHTSSSDSPQWPHSGDC